MQMCGAIFSHVCVIYSSRTGVCLVDSPSATSVTHLCLNGLVFHRTLQIYLALNTGAMLGINSLFVLFFS